MVSETFSSQPHARARVRYIPRFLETSRNQKPDGWHQRQSAYVSEMPALKNVRYEKFCENIATSPKTGLSQGQCYERAGFKTNGRSADACAARLLTDANIQTRIAELIEPAARKTRTTVDSLASQLDEVFSGATGDRQWGAAGSAAGLKAKLLGFMRERLEVGPVGAFDQCNTIADVAKQMLTDQPAAAVIEQLNALRGEIERIAADEADLIPAAEPARRRPDETALALAALRPGRR